MKSFEMSQDQLDTLMNSMKAAPVIAMHVTSHSSRQERANSAWEALGAEMGFDYNTVIPDGKGDRFFSAEEVVIQECKGIAIGDGNFSGCDASQGDCPTCGK